MTLQSTRQKESLFQIGEHFYALESILIDNDGEITEEVDQWLEEYQAKEEDKVDAYCYLIQKFEDIAQEAQRLAGRASSYNKKAGQLKSRLKQYLELRGKDKVETNKFTVTVCSNGGKLPLLLKPGITAEDLPDHYVRIYREPDMNQLRQALLTGEEEAENVAKLLPRGTHLRIK